MQLIQRTRDVVRAVLQNYGSAQIKRLLWDKEFGHGRWACLESTPEDCVYPFIEKYARGGNILDLGCGSGSTGNELDRSAYLTYTGVDVSEVAIQLAIRKTRANQRHATTSFVRAEFFSFLPDRRYDVILFRDSIYYIPLGRVSLLLYKYRAFLSDKGVFIVRLWGSPKNERIVRTIEQHFHVLETYHNTAPNAIIVVFR